MTYNPCEHIGIPSAGVPKVGVPKLPFINVSGKTNREDSGDKGNYIIVTTRTDSVDLTINNVKKTYTVAPNKPSKIYIKEDAISLYKMFYQQPIKEMDLSHFDTSNVTNMLHAFTGCSNLTNIDININTIKVTNMASMFGDCFGLTRLDISSFDMRSVNTINQICPYCLKLVDLNFGYNLKSSVDFRHSPLTHESALSVINGLAEVNTTQTVTFKSTTYATFAEEEIALATSKGWTIVSV